MTSSHNNKFESISDFELQIASRLSLSSGKKLAGALMDQDRWDVVTG